MGNTAGTEDEWWEVGSRLFLQSFKYKFNQIETFWRSKLLSNKPHSWMVQKFHEWHMHTPFSINIYIYIDKFTDTYAHL